MPISRDEVYVILPAATGLSAYHKSHFKEYLKNYNIWERYKIYRKSKQRIKKKSKINHFFLVLLLVAMSFVYPIWDLFHEEYYTDEMRSFMLTGFVALFIVIFVWMFWSNQRTETRYIAKWEKLEAELWGEKEIQN
jgi:uncharacterized ion transporter superfamily protein YfcC